MFRNKPRTLTQYWQNKVSNNINITFRSYPLNGDFRINKVENVNTIVVRGGHGSVNHINRTDRNKMLKWFGKTELNHLKFESNQTEPKLWFG